jgi:hypothetical protein
MNTTETTVQSTELISQDKHPNETITTAPDETRLPAQYAGSEALGPEDLALPRLAVAQSTSRPVQNELVPVGSIYVTHEPEDPDPQVVYTQDRKDGVVVHVLGHRKAWVYHDDEDRFTVSGRSPGAQIGPSADAQPAYELAVLVPAFDEQLPCSWLLKGSAMNVGKRVFTAATKESVPLFALAWSISTVQRQNERGRWFAPVATPIAKPRAEHVSAAAQAAQLLGAPSGE